MEPSLRPLERQFDPGHQLDPDGIGRRPGFGDAVEIVVIGEGDGLPPGFGGGLG